MKVIWIARDKDRRLYVYASKPLRKDTIFSSDPTSDVYFDDNVSEKHIPDDFYRDLTWENSPIKLILNLPK
jgi:hypothetical protein